MKLVLTFFLPNLIKKGKSDQDCYETVGNLDFGTNWMSDFINDEIYKSPWGGN